MKKEYSKLDIALLKLEFLEKVIAKRNPGPVNITNQELLLLTEMKDYSLSKMRHEEKLPSTKRNNEFYYSISTARNFIKIQLESKISNSNA